jgi:phosphate transport system substrate-binding protein
MTFRLAALLGVLFGALVVSACGDSSDKPAGERHDPALAGTIRIDGSSTVSPLTRVIARRFMAAHPGVRIAVGRAGDARGFARFCRGKTDLTDASMPIDAKTIDACEGGGVQWRRITVANDAVVLMLNHSNPIRCLTTDQLMQIWRGNSNVTERWSQVDGTNRPFNAELIAWGPGTETETFAFFTWAVNREQGITRDYNNALEVNTRTLGSVESTLGAIGYTAYALYRRKPVDVKLLAVDSGDGCVAPSPRTIADGTYRPFSRRLFLYVSARALARPEVSAFLRAYLDQAGPVARKAGFVPLTGAQLAASRRNLEQLVAAARR